MKSERDTTQRFTHRANLTQWRKISSGHLTPAERDFVERRMAEEWEALCKLAEIFAPGSTYTVVTRVGSPSRSCRQAASATPGALATFPLGQPSPNWRSTRGLWVW
jgi:hypothetical protein